MEILKLEKVRRHLQHDEDDYTMFPYDHPEYLGRRK